LNKYCIQRVWMLKCGRCKWLHAQRYTSTEQIWSHTRCWGWYLSFKLNWRYSSL